MQKTRDQALYDAHRDVLRKLGHELKIVAENIYQESIKYENEVYDPDGVLDLMHINESLREAIGGLANHWAPELVQ